jgi:hypothetical protein
MMTHTPNDCALLITAPLTKEDFLFDLIDSEADFVKNWARSQQLASDKILTDEDLWGIYSVKVKDFVLKIVDEIKSFGVKVILNAESGDLNDVFLEKKVVTLEAHWVSPKIDPTDFHDFDNFLKRLYKSDEIVARVLRKLVFSKLNEPDLSLQCKESETIEIVTKINKLFSSYNFKDTKPKPVLLESTDQNYEEEIWIHLNRFALECIFPSEIKQRCKIEMFDGLYTLDNFQNRIPLNFAGVIDFTVCNSELAGKYVKRSRPCLVITNRFPTDLKLRLILYKGAIKMLMADDCRSYVDSVFELRRQLLENLGEK